MLFAFLRLIWSYFIVNFRSLVKNSVYYHEESKVRPRIQTYQRENIRCGP